MSELSIKYLKLEADELTTLATLLDKVNALVEEQHNVSV